MEFSTPEQLIIEEAGPANSVCWTLQNLLKSYLARAGENTDVREKELGCIIWLMRIITL